MMWVKYSWKRSETTLRYINDILKILGILIKHPEKKIYPKFLLVTKK